jgi:DNA processing protein
VTAIAGTERAALVALLRHRPESRWPQIVAEVVESGSAWQLWRRSLAATLLPVPGEPDPIESAAADIDGWARAGLRFVTILDEDYPARLRGIQEAPAMLFARGALLREDPAVSVVGSRNASERGLAMAGGVARELVAAGITVVAGLALGIDTAAHSAALAAGGRTVAVIGTGIRQVYPARNRELHDEIARTGLLLSQFWPDAPARKHAFLIRNATMSGYGLATVVVEAGQTSGTRVQARLAVGHGRPVILTDLVVARNEWARALVGRPGVHLARGTDEVISTVLALHRTGATVADALRQFAGA